MNEKILLVFTGGTIGGEIKDNEIVIDENKRYLLLDMYDKLGDKEEIDFDIITPVSILSENALVEDWNKIAEEIKEKDISKYKGIIITYGTDTMGYFANALSYLLHKLEIPIVIVGSNFILTDKRANGLENFKTAVNFIVNKDYRGVFVVYKNDNQKMYIHQGIRIKQIGQLSGSAYSIQDDYFAQVIDGDIIVKDNHNNNQIINNNYNFKISNDIIYIKPIPGMKYDFNVDDYKVVLHEVFHAGTIPEHAMKLVKQCKEQNILFFIGPVFSEYKTLYCTTAEAVKEGAIIVSDISQEALLIKLMIACRNF